MKDKKGKPINLDIWDDKSKVPGKAKSILIEAIDLLNHNRYISVNLITKNLDVDIDGAKDLIKHMIERSIIKLSDKKEVYVQTDIIFDGLGQEPDSN